MLPLVSIVIAAYNAEKYIAESIESCLNQTYKDIEVIIVNDGSTDTTLSIIEKYVALDSRVCVVSQENKGVGASRNVGNNLAKGDLIAVLDSDDIMMSDRLMVQVEYMQQHPEIDVLGCWMEHINEKGVSIGTYKRVSNTINVSQFKEYQVKNIPVALTHSGVIYQTKKVKEVGGYRDLRPGQDADLWNRMVENGCIIVVLPVILGKYRIYFSNLNTSVTIKSFYTFYWLLYNSTQRRQKLNEISFEQYLALHRKKPFFERFKLDRQIHVEYHIRLFSLALGNKNYWQAVKSIFLAIVNNPFFVVKKIKNKMKFYLTNR